MLLNGDGQGLWHRYFTHFVLLTTFHSCRGGLPSYRNNLYSNLTKIGFVSQKAMYRCESGEGCPYKQNCTKAKGSKILSVSHKFKELKAWKT